MKYMLLAFTFFGFLQASYASDCYDSVLAEYEALLEDSYELDGFLPVSRGEAVAKIKESTEIEDEDKQAALQAVNSRKNVLFLGYSSQYGGSGEEILVVNKSSCKIIDRIYTFIE